MKNMVVLFKNDDGHIVCKQLSKHGIEVVRESQTLDKSTGGELFWDSGGTILLEELEEILDKEV